MTRLAVILLLAAAAAAGGCSPRPLSAGGPPVVDRVDRLDLWVSPVTIELNGRPGPDGIEFRLYLFKSSPGMTQPGLISEGQFQFLVYEGRLDADSTAQPFYQWEYSAAQMRGFFAPDKYGLGSYHATLNWAPRMPLSSTVTLIARYIDPDGRAIVSAPADVSARAK